MGMSGDSDEFGDRMKAYEASETARAFKPSMPIYARIDGRSFSRFTRGMNRPFDARMIASMVETTQRVVRETHARIAYTQSDEISLVWLSDLPGAEPLFGGKVHKLTSVLASLTTACFHRAIGKHFCIESERLLDMLPHFDARVFQLPTKMEAANAFLWRAMDARKNSVSMAARAHFSAKSLHGKDQAAMRAMLASGGVDFESAYPPCFKWGTWVRRVVAERRLTDNELARIPEKYRPAIDAPVLRSNVEVIAMPEFHAVTNRVEVVFDGAAPSSS